MELSYLNAMVRSRACSGWLQFFSWYKNKKIYLKIGPTHISRQIVIFSLAVARLWHRDTVTNWSIYYIVFCVCRRSPDVSLPGGLRDNQNGAAVEPPVPDPQIFPPGGYGKE